MTAICKILTESCMNSDNSYTMQSFMFPTDSIVASSFNTQSELSKHKRGKVSRFNYLRLKIKSEQIAISSMSSFS